MEKSFSSGAIRSFLSSRMFSVMLVWMMNWMGYIVTSNMAFTSETVFCNFPLTFWCLLARFNFSYFPDMSFLSFYITTWKFCFTEAFHDLGNFVCFVLSMCMAIYFGHFFYLFIYLFFWWLHLLILFSCSCTALYSLLLFFPFLLLFLLLLLPFHLWIRWAPG